jgi:hypothetical protein
MKFSTLSLMTISFYVMSAFLHFYIKHEIIRCFSDSVAAVACAGSNFVSPYKYSVNLVSYGYGILQPVSSLGNSCRVCR